MSVCFVSGSLEAMLQGRSPAGSLSVASVTLLDQHSCSATLLETLLLIVTAELGLNQDGRLRHFLVQCVLGKEKKSEMVKKGAQDSH